MNVLLDSTHPDRYFQEHTLENMARQMLLNAGVVDELKSMNVYIWAINAFTIKQKEGAEETRPEIKLILSVDTTLNKKIDVALVQKLVDYVLAPLPATLIIKKISISDHCCHGNCHGCLNGNTEAQPIWIGHVFSAKEKLTGSADQSSEEV